jgi:putative transposase
VRRSRFSVEQIVAVLKQAELGMAAPELIRKVGISEQTFYRWKKQDGSLQPDQARELKQPQEENARLKKVVADLSLDKVILRGPRAPCRSPLVRTWPPRGSRQRRWQLLDLDLIAGVHVHDRCTQPLASLRPEQLEERAHVGAPASSADPQHALAGGLDDRGSLNEPL